MNISLKNIGYSLLILFFVSCSKELPDNANELIERGAFVASAVEKYNLSLTRASENLIPYSIDGNMGVCISKSSWSGDLTTKASSIDGNAAEWRNAPIISLYITDANGNIKIGNIPYNGNTSRIYARYEEFNTRYNIVGPLSSPEEGYLCNKSSILWNLKNNADFENIKGINDMPVNANFYAYYPRPSDVNNTVGQLHYKKTTIVDQTDAMTPDGEESWRTDWNILKYSLLPMQTDDNLYQHDLMISLPESGEGIERWGNTNKKSGDNVQLHFHHAFALLNITLNLGSHHNNSGTSIVSDMEISGKKIYTEGSFDLKTGLATRTDKVSQIKRDISSENNTLTSSKPFTTNMIIQPCEPLVDGDFIFKCKIDGIEYKCNIKGVKFEANYQYGLNLTLAPEGLEVLRLWSGVESVTVNGKDYKEYENNLMVSEQTTFTVNLKNGYKIDKVLKDGEILTPNTNGSYNLQVAQGKNIYYNIVTVKEENWYNTSNLWIHYDGIQNHVHYDTQQSQSEHNMWHDLTGYSNHGTLAATFDFDGSTSGWVNGKGLAFDGDDDIVTFTGSIGKNTKTVGTEIKEYTISIILHTAFEQKKQHYRLIAEGQKYPSFYIYTKNSNDVGNLGIYAHAYDELFSRNATDPNNTATINVIDKTYQYDFVYNGTDVRVYINGNLVSIRTTPSGEIGKDSNGNEYIIDRKAYSIALASIGCRIDDKTRNLQGTYYGLLIYDKALTQSQITANWNVTQKRYSGLLSTWN